MEISQARWVSEMGLMEDSTDNFFQQYQINPTEYSLDELDFQSFSSESYSSYNQNMSNYLETYQTGAGGVVLNQRPAKQLKTSSWNSFSTTTAEYQQNNNTIVPKASSSSCSQIISFENSNSSPAAISQQYYGMDYRRVKPKAEVTSDCNMSMNFSSIMEDGSLHDEKFLSTKYAQGAAKRVGSGTRSALHAQDHVIAERQRREKLSQRFISLSALLPDLKKTDKASVLCDAIKYLKQLQEQVKTLEEQEAKKPIESAIFVKKSHICIDVESSPCDENFDGESNQPLPEIEARVSNKDVLIRIHCEKNKGHLVNILAEIEKLHLNVVNSNVIVFGNSTLHITIFAKMDGKFSISMKDLIKSIRLSLL